MSLQKLKSGIKKLLGVKLLTALTPTSKLMKQAPQPLYESNEIIAKNKLAATNTYQAAAIPNSPTIDLTVQSSFLERIVFYKNTGTLNVYFRDHSTPLQYFNVPEQKVNNVINAVDTATSNGSNQFGMWWAGKHSIGASYIQEIVEGGYESGVLDKVTHQE